MCLQKTKIRKPGIVTHAPNPKTTVTEKRVQGLPLLLEFETSQNNRKLFIKNFKWRMILDMTV